MSPDSGSDPSPTHCPLDSVAAELQELRLARGEPSYAEIAARIARVRTARGIPEARARVGRTTVYDVFRTGRKRLDLDLVLDIVRALDASEAEVDLWRERCLEAIRSARAVESAPAEPEPEPEPAVPAPPRSRSMRFFGLVLLGSFSLNLIGRGLVEALGLAIYLDMIGTAVAAVLLGPWWGALVGLSANVAGVAVSGPIAWHFALVNVVGALIWGYGYHRFGMGRSILRFFSLNLLVGAVCTVVATPIAILMYDGFTEHDSSEVARVVFGVIPSVPAAVFTSNLLLSLVDKMVSGYAALVARELTEARRPGN